MALSFLQALINPGPLSTAACIAAGIRAGAPKPVISQWLSAEEWWRFERGTVEVMNAAMNAGIVDFLLDQVVEHLPHAIDPVFHVLRQNEKPLMTTIKRLYQLAKTRGNDGLCVRIQQAFPGTVPVSGGSSKGKAPASGRSQRRLST